MCHEIKNDINREQSQDYIDSFKNNDHNGTNIIEVLHKANDLDGCFPSRQMEFVAIDAGIPTLIYRDTPATDHIIYSKPVERCIVLPCMDIVFNVDKPNKLFNNFKKKLNLNVEEINRNKFFTLKEARCLGARGQVPVAMANIKNYRPLEEKKAQDIIKKYKDKSKQEENHE